MTTVVISQPMYFPWAGYLDMISRADILVWLDDAQFSKGSFTNRVQVKLPSGIRWMTIPLRAHSKSEEIRDLQANGTNWIQSHRSMLRQSFAGYCFRDQVLALFEEVVEQQTGSLCDLLIASSDQLLSQISAQVPKTTKSSELKIAGKSWQRVLDIVKSVKGTQYLSAAGGANYIDHIAFERAGIAVEYIDYAFTPWLQTGDSGFTPYVTGLDLLAGAGDKATSHFRGRRVPWAEYLISGKEKP